MARLAILSGLWVSGKHRLLAGGFHVGRAVSTAVNKTGHGGSRGPELIEPIGEHGDQPLQLVTA